MEAFELILVLLAAVLLSSVIDQLVPKVSLPLIQIGLGFVIAVFAMTPIQVNLDPELFLVLFIAPLLYDEARHADKGALWRNRRSIVSLAVGLVLAIVLAVGFTLNLLIPSIPLAAAFALGAALGPTDAVAVSALKKDVSISKKQETLLSGESLINDASGVVAFQFAIGAATTGAFSLLDASVSFLLTFFGGIAIGLLLGIVITSLTKFVRSTGLENTTFHVLFEVFSPFIVFLMAESLHVSGILAVVAAGLLVTFMPKGIDPLKSRHSIVSSSVWQVLSFALNGIVFVLLGTQLPRAMQDTWDDAQINNLHVMGVVLALTAVVTAVRFLWTLGMEANRKDPSTGRKCGLSKASIRDAAIVTFAGPKGAVTLSIAFTIPLITTAGTLFPQRDLLTFLASGVILCTLLLANFLVPVLAPAKEEESDDAEEVALVHVGILRKVIEELADRRTPDRKAATRTVIASYNARIARIQSSNDLEQEPRNALRIKILRAQQNHALKRMENNDLDPVIGYRYIQRLAKVQNLLTHKRDNHWLVKNALRHFKFTFVVVWRSLLEAIPGAKTTQRSDIDYELHLEGEQIAVDLLRGEMLLDNFHAETVGSLLVEHEKVLRTLQTSRPNPSITAIARAADKASDIEREGLLLELEFIQEAYENGKLSRSSAKNLRENVHLMQLDLEDRV